MPSRLRLLLLPALVAVIATSVAGAPASGQPAPEGGGGGDCPTGSNVVVGAAADPDFESPVGVDVGVGGDVYVADPEANAVYRFEPDGTQTLSIPPTAGIPDLVTPTDVAADDAGNIYVADTGTDRIHRFTPAGTQTMAIGTVEADPNFSAAEGIAVNGPGTRIYVVDSSTQAVQRFDENGIRTLSFPTANAEPDPNQPNAIAVDSGGNIAVVDQTTDSVFRYDAAGNPNLVIGPTAANPDLGAVVGVAFDTARNVVVIDQNTDSVHRFSPTGTQNFRIDGFVNGGLTFARRVTVGRQGDFWATDQATDSLMRWCFRPDGQVRRGTGPFVGNGIVNTTGAGQSRSATLPAGGTASFTLRIDNDANAHDRIRVRGTGGNSRFRVRYFNAAQEVTGAVVAGTFLTPSIIPGTSRDLRVEVRANTGTPSGASRNLTIRLSSTAAPARTDTVKVTATRS